jgi:hypothetical protein
MEDCLIMKVSVQRVTPDFLVSRACEFTSGGKVQREGLEDRMLRAEHSPIRTIVYWIELWDIPSYVSTHLVRHNVGVTHFVKSNRDKEGVDRNTPVNHAMLINAQALINMARQRLCNKADNKTMAVMYQIRAKIALEHLELASYMVPDCVYRGHCVQPNPCGICGD